MKNKRSQNKVILSAISNRRKSAYRRIVKEQRDIQDAWERLGKSFLDFNSALNSKIKSALTGKKIDNQTWEWNSEQSQLDKLRSQSLKFAELFDGNNYRKATEKMFTVYNREMEREGV